jgi:small GTP-binding protein
VPESVSRSIVTSSAQKENVIASIAQKFLALLACRLSDRLDGFDLKWFVGVLRHDAPPENTYTISLPLFNSKSMTTCAVFWLWYNRPVLSGIKNSTFEIVSEASKPMDEYKAEKIRNVALVGHSSSGKTSLAEALLFNTGAVTRLGKVDDNTSVSDFDPEEQRRKISINTTLIPCEWNGYKVNILDTPGYVDFVGEVKSALRVADCAIVVVDAVSGVEVGTELVWQYAEEMKLPRIILINKLDRENADFDRALAQLRELRQRRGFTSNSHRQGSKFQG